MCVRYFDLFSLLLVKVSKKKQHSKQKIRETRLEKTQILLIHHNRLSSYYELFGTVIPMIPPRSPLL